MSLITRRGLLAGLSASATQLQGAGQARPASVGAVLVLGVSQYDHLPDLPSAVLDAALIATTFDSLGFDVSLHINVARDAFLHHLARFQALSRDAPLVLVYVAAHGGLMGGQSYLFLKDASSMSDRIPETLLMGAVNVVPRQKILFLDCCRNSLLPGGADALGLGEYRAGVHVSYATQPDAAAFDGGAGHSPYAAALHAALQTPGLDVNAMTQRARLDVIRATNGLQIPWDRSSLIQSVVLNQGP